VWSTAAVVIKGGLQRSRGWKFGSANQRWVRVSAKCGDSDETLLELSTPVSQSRRRYHISLSDLFDKFG